MAKVLVNEENLTNIANAIREKNGKTITYKPGDMASAISEIKTGSAVAYQPTRISFGLHYYPSDDDGNAYDMSNELNGLDTSKVKSLGSTFASVAGVPRLDLSGWNTSSCEDFTYMFEQSEFEYIDVSNFTFESAQTLGYFISGCWNLTTLILGEGWLNIGEWHIEDPNGFSPGGFIATAPLIDGTPINDGSGYIYVPDELVDQFKEHEVFMQYADQIRPVSSLNNI